MKDFMLAVGAISCLILVSAYPVAEEQHVNLGESAKIQNIDTTQNTYILVSFYTGIYWINRNGLQFQQITDSEYEYAVNLNVDIRNEVIYYATMTKIIGRCKFDGSDHYDIISTEFYINDIALDWISNKLYFTDDESVHVIEDLSNPISETILYPSSGWDMIMIVVDPYAKMMYFSEYQSRGFFSFTRIERASLTGADRTVIASNINRITDMVLDIPSQTIYFVDVNAHTVEKIDVNGRNREVLVSSENNIYFISFSNGIVYFSEASLIRSVSADGGAVNTVQSYGSLIIRSFQNVGPEDFAIQESDFCEIVSWYRLTAGVSLDVEIIRPTLQDNTEGADFYNQIVVPDLDLAMNYPTLSGVDYSSYAQLDLLLYYSFHPTLAPYLCPNNPEDILAEFISETINIMTADFLGDYSATTFQNLQEKLSGYAYFSRDNDYNILQQLDDLCTSTSSDSFCQITLVAEVYEHIESLVNSGGATEFIILGANIALLPLWDPTAEGLVLAIQEDIQDHAIAAIELLVSAVESKSLNELEALDSAYLSYLSTEPCAVSSFEGCLLHTAVNVLRGYVSKSTLTVKDGVTHKIIYSNTDYAEYFSTNLLTEILSGTQTIQSSLLDVAEYISTQIDCAADRAGSDILKNLGTYFESLSKFDESKAEHDVAYILGRLEMYQLRTVSLGSQVDSDLANILEGALSSAEGNLAYKSVKLAIAVAENANPFVWLFGGGSVNEVLDAIDEVAEAARLLARAEALGDRLANDVRPLLETIQQGLFENADMLDVIVDLVVNLEITDDTFQEQEATFLASYGAYSPVVTVPDLTSLGTHLELLASEGCDIIDATDGPAGVVDQYKPLLYGACLDVVVNIQALMATYFEIYDFQFELVEQLASVVKSRTALHAAANLESSWTSTAENCDSTDVLKRYAILAGVSETLYKLETWQAIEEYCTILEYENAGVQPSVCQGVDSNLADLTSYVTDQCYPTIRFYSFPAFVKTDSNYSTYRVDYDSAKLNLTALLAGESVSFQIPDSDWLIERGIIHEDEADLALYVRMFEIYLPVESSSSTYVRVLASPSASNHLIPGGTVYAMDTELVAAYLEGEASSCRTEVTSTFPNPYELCDTFSLPDICFVSLESDDNSLIYSPSLYARWNLQVVGYGDLTSMIRPSADMDVRVALSLCKKSSSSGRIQAKTRTVAKRKMEMTARIMQTESCCSESSQFWSQESQSCVECPSGTVPELYGYYCNDNDECSETEGMRCEHTCVNTIGSYFCSCDEGYKLSDDKYSCEDINECEEPTSCDQVCTNTIGSYECSCNDGYIMDSSGYYCDDIDECADTECETCFNTEGSYYCSCDEGYVWSDDGTCEDLDECSQSEVINCHNCVNTDGSYECSCDVGYTLNSNGYTCEGILVGADSEERVEEAVMKWLRFSINFFEKRV